METTGVRQGMSIMQLDVMDTDFQGLYSIKLSVEVSAVLHSEWTKYCPMLSVCDLRGSRWGIMISE